MRLRLISTASMASGMPCPLDFGCAVFGHEADNNAANYRHKNYPGSKLVMSRAGEFGNEAMIENNICEQANKLVEQKGNAAGNQPNGGSKERDQHHAELGGFGQTSVADRRAGCRQCRRMIAIAGSVCFDCGNVSANFCHLLFPSPSACRT